ncbi:MAG TPA: ABC transporter substrate-binding protein [Streptosporangiaceae bacterium]
MRFHSRRWPAAAVLAAAALLAAACGAPASPGTASSPAGRPVASGSFPVSIAAAGSVVRIAARPAAIVSLSPTATEMLYAIGAGPQVKAVDSLSDYPPGAPVTKLAAFQPNVEAIVAYKPDLVITSNDTGLAKKLAAFSVPVLNLPAPAAVAGEYAEFRELGQATGDVAGAQREIAALRAGIARIVAAVPHRARPLSYYYELDQTYYSVTSATFVGSLLRMLGMKSIADSASGAASAGGYPKLSPEFVVRANPDYIILADTVCCHQSAATVAARPGWSTLSAVKDGHVITLNDDIASRWGPRVASLMQAVETGISKGTK